MQSRSTLALVLSLVVAACSAASSSTASHGAGGHAGAGATGGGGAGGDGAGGASGGGGSGGDDAGTPDDGSAGSGGVDASIEAGGVGGGGTGGGGTGGGGTGGGGAGGGGAGGGGAGGGALFDGGWHPPDSGTNPPLTGNGGTTVAIGSGADSGSPGKFGGSATGGAIQVVYPSDGVIVPPNMNALEIHFLPAAGQTLFELAFHAPTMTYTVYTGCTPLNGGCVFATDAGWWAGLVPYARGTQPVSFTIRGVNGASPGAVGTSPAQTIAFGQQDMGGGIYYWNDSGIIQRYDWGLPGKPPELYMTGPQALGLICVGCHVLSRDGKYIAAGTDIPAPAAFKVFDVATRTEVVQAGTPLAFGANFASFSPDDQQMISSDGTTMAWLSLGTGAVLNGSLGAGAMPDWSPDGTKLTYAKGAGFIPFAVPGVSSASLETITFNGTAWSAPQTLVPFQSANNYYPAWDPTGAWVAYNRSASNENSFANAAPDPDAGTVPDGELWMVNGAGGSPLRLDRASSPGALQWPKWAPFVHDYYDGKILWLTFSSARQYGLRLTNGERTQLWTVGVDLAKAAAGQDPSYPGFWMPFQDFSGGNHIAQWVTTVQRKPCTGNSECDNNLYCRNGVCQPG